MISSCFYLALIFLMFETAFADSNLFLDDGGITADNGDINNGLIYTDSQESGPGENLFDANANIFASLPDEKLLDTDALASCLFDPNGQPMLRARGDACLPASQTTITNPKLPGLTDIENALENKPGGSSGPEKNRPTGPYLLIVVDDKELGANEPEYYCQLSVTPYSLPPPFAIPICGSGEASDRSSKRGDYTYMTLYNGRLRKSIHPTRSAFKPPSPKSPLNLGALVLPGPSWECPESEFFCCKNFEPNDVSRRLLFLVQGDRRANTYKPEGGIRGCRCSAGLG